MAEGYLKPGTLVIDKGGRTGRILRFERNPSGTFYDIQFKGGWERYATHLPLTALDLDDPIDLETWLNAP